MSVGKEIISKSIVYYKTSHESIVTLTLGNILADSSLDVFSINNNGDRNKILATVSQSIQTFLEIHPHMTIAFTGSSPSRTRLYKMVISRELDVIKGRYSIRGINELGIEAFDPQNRYEAFLVSLK